MGPFIRDETTCHTCNTVIGRMHAKCTTCGRWVHSRKKCRVQTEDGSICTNCFENK